MSKVLTVTFMKITATKPRNIGGTRNEINAKEVEAFRGKRTN